MSTKQYIGIDISLTYDEFRNSVKFYFKNVEDEDIKYFLQLAVSMVNSYDLRYEKAKKVAEKLLELADVTKVSQLKDENGRAEIPLDEIAGDDTIETYRIMAEAIAEGYWVKIVDEIHYQFEEEGLDFNDMGDRIVMFDCITDDDILYLQILENDNTSS